MLAETRQAAIVRQNRLSIVRTLPCTRKKMGQPGTEIDIEAAESEDRTKRKIFFVVKSC